jgi:hypothetical protein
MRRFLTWLAPLLLLVAGWVPPLPAQNSNAGKSPDAEDKPELVPAGSYTLAFLITILILTIVCMPSRKATH